MPKRGELTPAIKKQMQEFFERDVTQRELRLLPYIQYTMMNTRKLDPRHINGEEREVLQKWREAGHIEGGASGLAITRDFWNFMNVILFQAYVAYDDPQHLSSVA